MALGRPRPQLEQHRQHPGDQMSEHHGRLGRVVGEPCGTAERCHRRFEAGLGVGQESLDGRGEQILLGREVPVDGPLGHPGGLGDVADGHLAVAAGLERLDRRRDHPGPALRRIGGRLGPDALQGRQVALVVAEPVGRLAHRRRDHAGPAIVVDGAGRNSAARH